MSNRIYSGALILSVKDAAKVAQLWKTARQQDRNTATILFGENFVVQIESTHTKFRFYADGRGETLNCKPQARPMHLSIDKTRQVVGFSHGRPIYA